MPKNFLLILMLFTAIDCSAQEEDEVPSVVEVMPEFPGGQEGLIEFLIETVTYPVDALEEGVSGTVFLTFVVERDGKIEHAKVVKGIDPRCDSTALAAVYAMPQWTPGMSDGDSVRVKYNLPVKFTLPAKLD